MKDGLLNGFWAGIPYGTNGVGVSLGDAVCVLSFGMLGIVGMVSCEGDCICPFDPYITGPCEYCMGVG